MCYNQQSNSLFLAWYDFLPVCTVNAQYVLFMFAILQVLANAQGNFELNKRN